VLRKSKKDRLNIKLIVSVDSNIVYNFYGLLFQLIRTQFEDVSESDQIAAIQAKLNTT